MSEPNERVSREVNHRLAPLAGEYEFDAVHTFIGFSAQHLVVGRVRGRFEVIQGHLVVGEDLLASGVEITIETKSLNTLMPIRDDDLRSANFLDVANYPYLTFRSSTITELADGGWSVLGNLTIRDVTKPTELLVQFRGATTDSAGRTRIAFHASGSISRREYGLNTELMTEAGSLLVGRDVALDMDIEATLTSNAAPR